MNMKNYKIKKCQICNKEFKPKSGFQKFCSKNCFKKAELIYRKKYYILSKGKFKEDRKKYHKIYRKNHKLELTNKKKEYYQKNREKILIKLANYRKLHSEELKQYRKEHKKERKEYQKTYLNNRLKTDINFKLAHYLRTRIVKVLKGNPKASTTMKLLGCSIDLLRLHLQSKFQPGMSFSNYGKWHVDHIIPCARFDLTKESEQKECFNWKNLQPLWAEENLKKSDK